MKSTNQSSPSGRRLLTVVKQPIHTIAFSNINLIAPPVSISGRTLLAEDRILLTAQTTSTENGIYGFDGDELKPSIDWLNEEGQHVTVIGGTYIGKEYIFTNNVWSLSTAGTTFDVLLTDGTTTYASSIRAIPGITVVSEQLQPWHGDETSANVTLSTDASTAVLTQVFSGLSSGYGYNCTFGFRVIIWSSGDASQSGSIDGLVDLYVTVDGSGVASCTLQTTMIPDVSRLPTALAGATVALAASTGGVTISATRPTGVACNCSAAWWVTAFKNLGLA